MSYDARAYKQHEMSKYACEKMTSLTFLWFAKLTREQGLTFSYDASMEKNFAYNLQSMNNYELKFIRYSSLNNV